MRLWAVQVQPLENSLAIDLKTGEKTEIKAGQSADFGGRNPIWISSAGRIPVLMVPLRSDDGVVKIDSPRVEDALNEGISDRIDSSMSEVMLFMSEIHRYLGKKDLVGAKQKLAELKSKYPRIQFLNFIESSISLLSGDKEKALSYVKLGLAAHPNYGPGLELLKQLEGAASP